jgi:hypothetical protein
MDGDSLLAGFEISGQCFEGNSRFMQQHFSFPSQWENLVDHFTDFFEVDAELSVKLLVGGLGASLIKPRKSCAQGIVRLLFLAFLEL